MTPVHELLTTLAKLNVKLWVEDDRLRLSAPNGVLTNDLQEQLQELDINPLFVMQAGDGVKAGDALAKPLAPDCTVPPACLQASVAGLVSA